ncbi:MAG: WD40/YVTN/BNR-like repeat-containing protein [Gemmatimonadaceae bacterium]
MKCILVTTWEDGLFVIAGSDSQHELAGHSVRGLAPDRNAGTLAIIDGHELRQRNAAGEWRTLATSKLDLSCCVSVTGVIYVGTDDARVLRVTTNGELEDLTGFANTAGRDKWYAGAAIVDGKLMGPPLGIRSMTATCDGTALLANVHVGGIPRSVDDGMTWHPTIDINDDVHEVRAHESRPDIVIAAAATGLGISRDGGATWTVERDGLHATHCSAVAFAGDDILVSASEDPFSPQGAVYRRPLDGMGPLQRLGGGLPQWLERRVDTGCIATRGSAIALADGGGNLYLSQDAARTWSRVADHLPAPSGVLIV